jgi:hypothetical protein
MNLRAERYIDQVTRWPAAGRHILAHYDDETIIVYQAYSRDIGSFAVAHGFFGGAFGLGRMSWVKPNFLWMMYRSDWGRSANQEVILAVRLRRTFFDSLLAQAVRSSFDPADFADRRAWAAAVQRSDVRLQWDPDHAPSGQRCERRAIQLGLRGNALIAYSRSEVLEIIDMSEFVAEQRVNIEGGAANLLTPFERVYLPRDGSLQARLRLTAQPASAPGGVPNPK